MFLNMDLFQKKASRRERHELRQRVLDELTELEPEQRRERVERAIAAGELEATDSEFVLRVADQVEKLRVMIVPSQIRWPEIELIGAAPRTFADQMIGGRRNDAEGQILALPRVAGERVGIPIDPAGVDPELLALFANEPWPSIAWLRPEIPAGASGPSVARAGSAKRLGSREPARARRLKRSSRPEPSRRPVRPA